MRDWRGLIAFVLALGVAIALVAGVLSAEITPGSVTPQEGSFFSTLGGAIVGAVATYLGVTHTQSRNGGNAMRETTESPDRPPERDEPVEPEPVPNGDPATDQPAEEPEPPEPVQPPPEEGQVGECVPEKRDAPREGQPWGLTDYRKEGGEDGA